MYSDTTVVVLRISKSVQLFWKNGLRRTGLHWLNCSDWKLSLVIPLAKWASLLPWNCESSLVFKVWSAFLILYNSFAFAWIPPWWVLSLLRRGANRRSSEDIHSGPFWDLLHHPSVRGNRTHVMTHVRMLVCCTKISSYLTYYCKPRWEPLVGECLRCLPEPDMTSLIPRWTSAHFEVGFGVVSKWCQDNQLGKQNNRFLWSYMTSTTNQYLWNMQIETSIEKATLTLSQRRILIPPPIHLGIILSCLLQHKVCVSRNHSNPFFHRRFFSCNHPIVHHFLTFQASLFFVPYRLGTFRAFPNQHVHLDPCWILGTGNIANPEGPNPPVQQKQKHVWEMAFCWFIDVNPILHLTVLQWLLQYKYDLHTHVTSRDTP